MAVNNNIPNYLNGIISNNQNKIIGKELYPNVVKPDNKFVNLDYVGPLSTGIQNFFMSCNYP